MAKKSTLPTATHRSLEARLKAIPGLLPGVRRKILEAVAQPLRPADTDWLQAVDAQDRRAAVAVRRLMGDIRRDVARIEAKMVRLEYRHKDALFDNRFRRVRTVSESLSRLAVAAFEQQVEAWRPRPGRPKSPGTARNFELTFRIADVFREVGEPTPDDPNSLFGQVVAAVVCDKPFGEPGRYLALFAKVDRRRITPPKSDRI